MFYLDGHCHLFNLHVVYNDDTKKVLYRRIREVMGIPWLTANIAMAIVRIVLALHQKEDPEFVKCSQDIGLDLDALVKSEQFQQKIREHTPPLTGWFFRYKINRLMDPARRSPEQSGMLEFIRTGLRASTLSIAKDFMASLGEVESRLGPGAECGCVPLMMDFVPDDDDEIEKNERQFRCQVNGLMKVVACYPGFVLPFLSVNPKRGPSAVAMLREYYDDFPFCGVKIYPSMGYTLTEIKPVLQYCNDNQIPVLMHCNKGGFRRGREFADHADPQAWEEPLLNRFKNLRFCFGHFGGSDYFTGSMTRRMNKRLGSTYAWTEKIISLMKAGEGRIFADLSYHDLVIKDHEQYFDVLSPLLVDPSEPGADSKHTYRQILFGTDFWMLTASATTCEYWDFFINKYRGTPILDRICSTNIQRFLGIEPDKPEGPHAENIENFAKKLKAMLGEDVCDNNVRMATWLEKTLAREDS